MWIDKRSAQDHLNDYWNALDRQAPPNEVARLRALLEPELLATIDTARARFRRLRPDPAFSDRLEGELMNAFAVSSNATAALPPIQAPPANGRHEPWTPSRSIPTMGEIRTNRRSLALQLGMAALLLLTLIAGFFVFSNRSDHPAVLHPGTPVSTPTEDWTNTRGDAGRSGLGASGPVGHPVTIWRFQADGPCDTAPAAVGDTVFAACGNGILYAIDRATGVEQWQFSARSPVIGGPTVASGIVVLVDVDGRLYGVDAAKGQQLWIDEGLFTGSSVGQNGTLVAGGGDGDLVAFDVATGQEQWRTEIDPGGEVKSPAIGDGIAYAGSVGNGFTAVDLATGEIVWHVDTDGIETGTAVVSNGIAYIGSAPGVPEGFLIALDAKTGDQLWKSDEPIFSPAVQDGIGYAGSGGGEVTSVDLATGDVLWQITVGGVARPATVAGDVVYMNSDGDQAIYAFDNATGDQVWKFPVDGYLGDAPALKDGVLYATTGGGSIYALGGENAIPAPGATTPSPESAASAAVTIEASPVAAAIDPLSSKPLWKTPGGDGGFAQPGRVAISPNGQIWVTDNGNHRFQIFDAQGTFLETWGTQGKDVGEFQFLTRDRAPFGDIVFASDGSFFVLDAGNGRVQHFGAKRQFISSFGSFGTGPGQFTVPLDIALAPDGTLWVTDDKRQDAQQFDQDGTYLSSISAPEGFFFAWDHLIDWTGNHYFSVAIFDGVNTTFDVIELAPDGSLIRRIATPTDEAPVYSDEFTEMVFDADGRLLVGSGIMQGSSVYVFAQDGSLLGEVPTDADVQGLAFDSEGNLIVSSVGAGTLSSYRIIGADATQVAKTGPALLWTTEGGDTGLSQPGHVTIAPDGNIWVADNNNHRFQIVAADGTSVETWGEQGKGDGQFQMRRPGGDGYGAIAFAPDGSFYVVDPGNSRVQEFDADRQFVRVIGGPQSGDAQFVEPIGLVVDADGSIWVYDEGRHDVQHFGNDGALLGSFETMNDAGLPVSSNGLALAPDGTIYVSDTGLSGNQFSLVHYSQDGALLGTIAGDPDDAWASNQAVVVAFDADGRLYVTSLDGKTSNGHVTVFDSSGVLLTDWPIGGNPYGIALDDDGNAYVTQWLDGTLNKYQLPVFTGVATPVA